MLALLQKLVARERLRTSSRRWAPGTGGASGATDYRMQVVGFHLGKGAPVAAEDQNREVTNQGECTDCPPQERSFDALARGLANGNISRGRALRLLGGALL